MSDLPLGPRSQVGEDPANLLQPQARSHLVHARPGRIVQQLQPVCLAFLCTLAALDSSNDNADKKIKRDWA